MHKAASFRRHRAPSNIVVERQLVTRRQISHSSPAILLSRNNVGSANSFLTSRALLSKSPQTGLRLPTQRSVPAYPLVTRLLSDTSKKQTSSSKDPPSQHSRYSQEVRVACVQAEPAMFSKSGCLEKIKTWTEKAVRDHKAELVVFPEAFVPGYPRGLSFGFQVGTRSREGRKTWQLFHENAFDVEDDGHVLCEVAHKHKVDMVVGVVEREKVSSSLYCSLVYVSARGTITGVHRKLKPTGSERLIWGQGDGSTLHVQPLTKYPHLKVGGLICWENYMPHARLAIYARQPHIYVAPTADARPAWTSLMRTISCEGRTWTLGCNQFQSGAVYEPIRSLLTSADKEDLDIYSRRNERAPEAPFCSGGSVIVDPMGNITAGPLLDQEGILSAVVKEEDIVKAKLDFDVMGHYSSSEIFRLAVDTESKQPFVDF